MTDHSWEVLVDHGQSTWQYRFRLQCKRCGFEIWSDAEDKIMPIRNLFFEHGIYAENCDEEVIKAVLDE